MPVNSKTFSQLVTFSRASGATRVNSAGLIVGVDFSSTSNTIGTGSKTFTLTADAGVNRDWPAGYAIRAVDQVGGGTMNGTVTSYTASTQALVINVTSITGSGTSTNWRIGSLEFRRDFDPVTVAPRGGLVEGQATNDLRESETSNWVAAGAGPVLPVINNNQTRFGEKCVEIIFDQDTSVGVGTSYALKNTTIPILAGFTRTMSAYISLSRPLTGSEHIFLLETGASGAGTIVLTASNTTNLVSRFERLESAALVIASGNNSIRAYVQDTGTRPQSPVSVYITKLQSEVGSVATSYIPTTTVAVTRAADLANIDGTRFSGAYNQSQGTIYVEMTPLAGAVQAVAASINDGTLNNAIRVGQKQSGTLSSIRAIASDGVTDVMALNATVGNTLRSNGIDYSEVSDGGGVGKLGVATSATGAFLNVGGSENIRNSADSGLTYNARTIGGTLAGAHFGIGRFVIAGSTATINGATAGSVIVSTDGLSFRRINIPGLTQNLNEVTSNGSNQYVAVGNGGVIYTSPDAETWTARTSGIGSNINGATFGAGIYVAAASNGTQAVLTSPDGITWTVRTTPNASFIDIAYNGTNLFVAVAGGGAIATSPDGITWTSRTSGVTATLNGVHFADSLWVAVGNAGTVVTSPDGITWTDRTATSGTTQTINEVGFFGGKFYYVGASQVIGENTAANIVAGTTWTARTANVTSTLAGIATNGTRLLTCGASGAIATSEDGITFTSRTGNNATLNGAAFGNGTYVVVGDAANGSGLIATVDPTTFAYTRRVSGTTQDIIDVVFSNGMFFALSAGTQGIITSTDGINWTPRTTSNSAFFGLAYSGTTYVAAANSGNINTSSNGTTWALVPDIIPGFTGSWLGCVYKSGLFVIVGQQGRIATSPDGTTWTSRTSGTTQALYAANYSTRDQCFYAAGDGGVILRSADGITWENIANDAIGASIAGGSIQANPALGNLIPNAINKVAMRFAGNDFAVSVNGADAVIDSSGSLPSVDRLSLGMSGTGANPFNGYIRKVQYYPVPKSNADLKVLTQ